MGEQVRKIVIWSGIILVTVLLAALLVNACLVCATGAQLEKRLAALRAAGEPVSLKDLARPPIPPEKNAAVFLDRARADVTAIENEIRDMENEIWDEIWELSRREDYENLRLDAAGQKKVQGLFEAYPKVLPLLEQAAACADYSPPLDFTVAPDQFVNGYVEHLRRHPIAARVLRARIALLVAEGRRDEALQTTLILYRLTRHFDREPAIIGCLVALACRGMAKDVCNKILQGKPVSKEARQALEVELAEHDSMQGWIGALRTERTFGLYVFGTLPMGNSWLAAAYSNRSRLGYFDMIDREIAVAGEPYAASKNRTAASASDWTVRTLLPGIQGARTAAYRSRAEVRALRVLNAIQAKVPAGSSEIPKLSELGLPPEAITDPFNGEPLRIKRLPEGWLIYSVGSNLQDDGGEELDGLRDAGIGPIRHVQAPGRK